MLPNIKNKGGDEAVPPLSLEAFEGGMPERNISSREGGDRGHPPLLGSLVSGGGASGGANADRMRERISMSDHLGTTTPQRSKGKTAKKEPTTISVLQPHQPLSTTPSPQKDGPANQQQVQLMTLPETPNGLFETIAQLGNKRIFAEKNAEDVSGARKQRGANANMRTLPVVKRGKAEYTSEEVILRENGRVCGIQLPELTQLETPAEFVRNRMKFLKSDAEARELFDEHCLSLESARNHEKLVKQNERAQFIQHRLEEVRAEAAKRREAVLALRRKLKSKSSQHSGASTARLAPPKISPSPTSSPAAPALQSPASPTKRKPPASPKPLGRPPLPPWSAGGCGRPTLHSGLTNVPTLPPGVSIAGFLTGTDLENKRERETISSPMSPRKVKSTDPQVDLEGSSYVIGGSSIRKEKNPDTGKTETTVVMCATFAAGTIGKKQPTPHPLETPQYYQRLQHARDSVQNRETIVNLSKARQDKAVEVKQSRLDLIAQQKLWLKCLVLTRSMVLIRKLTDPKLRKMKARSALLVAACCAGRWRQLAHRSRKRKDKLALNCIFRKYVPALVGRYRRKKFGRAIDTLKVFLADLKTVFHFPRAIERFARGVKNTQRIVLRHQYARKLWKAAMLVAWEAQVQRDLQDYMLLTSGGEGGDLQDPRLRRRLRNLQNEIKEQGKIRTEEYMLHGEVAKVPVLMFVPFEFRVAVVNQFVTRWSHAMIRALIEQDAKKAKGEWVDPDPPTPLLDDDDPFGNIQSVTSITLPENKGPTPRRAAQQGGAAGGRPRSGRRGSNVSARGDVRGPRPPPLTGHHLGASPNHGPRVHSRRTSRRGSNISDAGGLHLIVTPPVVMVDADIERATSRHQKNQKHREMLDKANPGSSKHAVQKSSADVVKALRNKRLNPTDSLRLVDSLNKERQMQMGSGMEGSGTLQPGSPGSPGVRGAAGEPSVTITSSPRQIKTNLTSPKKKKMNVKVPGRMWIRKDDITKLVRTTQQAILRFQTRRRELRIQGEGMSMRDDNGSSGGIRGLGKSKRGSTVDIKGSGAGRRGGGALAAIASMNGSLAGEDFEDAAGGPSAGEFVYSVSGKIDVSGVATNALQKAIVSGVFAKNYAIAVKHSQAAFGISSRAPGRSKGVSPSGPSGSGKNNIQQEDRQNSAVIRQSSALVPTAGGGESAGGGGGKDGGVHAISKESAGITTLEIAAFLSNVVDFTENEGLTALPPPLDLTDNEQFLLAHPEIALEATMVTPQPQSSAASRTGSPTVPPPKKGFDEAEGTTPAPIPPFLEFPDNFGYLDDMIDNEVYKMLYKRKTPHARRTEGKWD